MEMMRKLIGFAIICAFSLIVLLVNAQAQPAHYSEAPTLANQVASGELPSIEERLPTNPLVVQPNNRIGNYGGTLRSALVGGGDGAWFQRTIAYDNLVRWDVEWTEVIPNIAEAFEASEDATEYTFYLREGMRWSDGQPFSADDIMFWYEDVSMNEELTPIRGNNPPHVEKIDDYTVRFTFEEPEGLFLQNLATTGGWIYTSHPRHYAEQFHIKYNLEGIDALIQEAGVADWVALYELYMGGAGRWAHADRPTLEAWMITRPYDGSTTRVVAERNPYYWKVDPDGKQLPYIDQWHFDILEDVEVLLLRTLAGEIDFMARHINTTTNMAILYDHMSQGNYWFFDEVAGGGNTMRIYLNLTHNDPVKREIFQNRDFRIGLSYAMNRQEIIDLIYIGQGEPKQIGAPRDTPMFHEQLYTQYTEYDVDRANEYLDRAGFAERDAQGYRLGPDGNRISFVVEVVGNQTDRVDALGLIQLNWSEVGIDMHVRPVERSLFYTRKDANEHDAVVWGGRGSGLDAVVDPRIYFPWNLESNFAQPWSEWYMTGGEEGEEPPAQVRRQMELYNQVIRTGDAERQNELMREIFDIAAEEFFIIGTSSWPPGYGIVSNRLQNVPDSIWGAFTYPTPAPTNPEQYFFEDNR